MEVIDITKKDFQAYEAVRLSGVTNMWAVKTVCNLSGLETNQVMAIMKNYGEYEELFGGDQQ